MRSTDRVVDTQLCKLSVTSAARVLQHAVQISFFGVQICFIPTVLTFPSRAVLYSREYHLFEVWSDWLTVRGRIALTGLGLGLGLGLVLVLPYTVCQPFSRITGKQPSCFCSIFLCCGASHGKAMSNLNETCCINRPHDAIPGYWSRGVVVQLLPHLPANTPQADMSQITTGASEYRLVS